MGRLPKVVSPLVRLGRREGVELVLVSVETWEDEVVVRPRGLASELTADLDAGFHDALETWHREGSSGRSPSQPTERIFPGVSLRDDVGTVYALRASNRGGSGTMFRADYVFRPGPPPDAAALLIGVDGPDGVETVIAL